MDKTLDLKLVNAAIESRGLKKKWIAKQIGVAANTLGDYLHGRSNLSKPAQILLAQVLNLNGASDKAS